MDRLQALKIFVAVAEAESFAAGAKAMGLSAPSATRGVNSLEEMLQTRLFTRTTRQVRLTETGRAYLEEVRDILSQLHAADEAALGAGGAPVGQLRITCPQEFGRIFIAPLVAQFLDRYPDVNADVMMLDRNVNLVEEGYDVALRIGHLPSSGLSAIRVGSLRRVVCGSPEYFARHGRPRVPADLVPSHRMILTTSINLAREWRFGVKEQETVRFDPKLTLSSVAASIEVARRGWGLCRALSYQVMSDIETGALETVLENHEPEPLPVHIVHVEGRKAPAKTRTFINFAVDHLRRTKALQP